MDLFQVMDDAVKFPLSVYFELGTQSEAVQTDGVSQVGKRRFADGQTHAVENSAGNRIKLPFHFLSEGRFAFFRPAIKIGDLAECCAFGIAQTLGAEPARHTG